MWWSVFAFNFKHALTKVLVLICWIHFYSIAAAKTGYIRALETILNERKTLKISSLKIWDIYRCADSSFGVCCYDELIKTKQKSDVSEPNSIQQNMKHCVKCQKYFHQRYREKRKRISELGFLIEKSTNCLNTFLWTYNYQKYFNFTTELVTRGNLTFKTDSKRLNSFYE